jgi:hypothetical protein
MVPTRSNRRFQAGNKASASSFDFDMCFLAMAIGSTSAFAHGQSLSEMSSRCVTGSVPPLAANLPFEEPPSLGPPLIVY